MARIWLVLLLLAVQPLAGLGWQRARAEGQAHPVACCAESACCCAAVPGPGSSCCPRQTPPAPSQSDSERYRAPVQAAGMPAVRQAAHPLVPRREAGEAPCPPRLPRPAPRSVLSIWTV